MDALRPELERLRFGLERAILALDRAAAREIGASALDTPPLELIEQVIAPVLQRLGAGWERGTVALSQVYMGGRICEELVERLLPDAHPDRIARPRMAIAVYEDHHQLGKRIVLSALRAAGHDVLDYGRGTAESLAERVPKDGVEVLMLSALMLPSALNVRRLVDRLNEGPAPRPRIVVGGAPFILDRELWREVGADCTGANAAEAIAIAARLSKELA